MSIVARTGAVPVAGRVWRLVRIRPRSRSLTIAARPERVREARRFVAAVLGPDHPCLDAATEVVSELVTNAVLHGSANADAKIKVRVRLLRHGRVHLIVIDEGGTGGEPTLRRPARTAPTGIRPLPRAAAARSWRPVGRDGTGRRRRVAGRPVHGRRWHVHLAGDRRGIRGRTASPLARRPHVVAEIADGLSA